MKIGSIAPPFPTAAGFRSIEEARIADLLLLYGWVHEIRAGADVAAEAQPVLDRWVKLGLPSETVAGRRCFDPVEVLNFMKWASLRLGDPFWEKRAVGTGRRLVRDQHGRKTTADACPDPPELTAAKFKVRLSREFHLHGHPPGTSVRLRSPLPMLDGSIGALQITPIPLEDLRVHFTMAPGRLDAQLEVPKGGTVSIGAEMSFEARPSSGEAAPVSDADRELYTRPKEGLICVSPRITALADTLAAASDVDTFRNFWNFMLDELTCGAIRYDLLDKDRPADWVLETGWYDCQLGAALLAALCRARGIPARIVGGYLLYPVSPSQHYWLEAHIGGAWRPFDLISSDLSVRGRDAAWRDCFYGRLDYRMKTQILPRIFDASPGIRLPPAWHLLAHAVEGGIESGFYDADTGALVYRERLLVERL